MLGFLYVFHIRIDELTNKLWFLAITVLHSPLGQAGYRLRKGKGKDGEINCERCRERGKEGEGGREGRDIERGAWQEARGA